MELGPPPPIMKSFKEFLLSLDDSVDETEAVKRYNEYKIDFRRQQMQDFFLAHKDEEWYDFIWFIFKLMVIYICRYLYISFSLILISHDSLRYECVNTSIKFNFGPTVGGSLGLMIHIWVYYFKV